MSTVVLQSGEWTKFLRDLKANASNSYKWLMAGANTYGFRNVIEHFSKEEGPSGKWTKRSSRTQEMYKRLSRTNSRYNPNNKLLQLTGNLRKSLLSGGSQNLKRYGNNAVMMFTNIEYAGKHNYGKGRIPQREFMWLSDKTQSDILELVLNKVVGTK